MFVIAIVSSALLSITLSEACVMAGVLLYDWEHYSIGQKLRVVFVRSG